VLAKGLVWRVRRGIWRKANGSFILWYEMGEGGWCGSALGGVWMLVVMLLISSFEDYFDYRIL